MVRVALLLLMVAGLVIFALQNLAPIALVVLGANTLALPLAVWVLGSLAAGAFTTLLLTGFFSLSKAGAVRRAGQRLSDSAGMPRSPWGGVGTKRGTAEASGTRDKNTVGFRAASSARPGEGQNRSRQMKDEWEPSNIDRETWDDWGEPEPTPRRTTQSASQTNVRDTADDDWARWDDPRSAGSSSARRSGARSESNVRPTAVDRDRVVPNDLSGRNDDVYDADYRVLVPPYSTPPTAYDPPPPPKPTPPEPDPLDDDDDWGLDDLDPKK